MKETKMETEKSNGMGQIYGLMATVLSEVGSISKGRRNEQQGYKFRGIDDVYEAVHPLFAKHGIFTVPRVLSEETNERTTASGTVLRFVKLTMAYDFFAPDGSRVTAEMIGEAMDAGDKASNKAMSAAQKYALIQTFCIPTGTTPDADYQTHEDLQPETRRVSKSNTATEKCPQCSGAMWDNRESKRNPKAPDYKCKNRSCDGAVWLDSQEVEKPKRASSKGVDESRRVLVQSVADGFKALNKLRDAPPWTKRTVNDFFALHFQGAAGVDELDDEQISDLLRMVSEKIDSMKGGSEKKANIILSIKSYFDTDKHLENFMKDHGGKKLEELTIPELEKIELDVTVPF
jgi:hypothetical protein